MGEEEDIEVLTAARVSRVIPYAAALHSGSWRSAVGDEWGLGREGIRTFYIDFYYLVETRAVWASARASARAIASRVGVDPSLPYGRLLCSRGIAAVVTSAPDRSRRARRRSSPPYPTVDLDVSGRKREQPPASRSSSSTERGNSTLLRSPFGTLAAGGGGELASAAIEYRRS